MVYGLDQGEKAVGFMVSTTTAKKGGGDKREKDKIGTNVHTRH